MQAKVNDKTYDIELLEKEGNIIRVKLNGEIIELDAVLTEQGYCSMLYNGRSYNAECVNSSEGKYTVTTNFRRYEVALDNLKKRYIRGGSAADDEVQDNIKAPMPGKIVKILVQPGQAVKEGDALIIIEAMKMQSTYTAAQDSIVDRVEVEEGEAVLTDQLLISFKHDN